MARYFWTPENHAQTVTTSWEITHLTKMSLYAVTPQFLSTGGPNQCGVVSDVAVHLLGQGFESDLRVSVCEVCMFSGRFPPVSSYSPQTYRLSLSKFL